MAGLRTTPDPRLPRQRAVLDAIADRRSVRAYLRDPIPREAIERLVEAAGWAPSNWNCQPWRFVVLDDVHEIRALHDMTMRRADVALAACAGNRAFEQFIEHCTRYFDVIRDCPVVIATCYKPVWNRIDRMVAEHLGDGDGCRDFNPNLISLGMATQNLMLAADELGLATCFHSGPIPFLRGAFQRRFDLPENLELAGLVTVGWPDPAMSAVRPSRKPVARICQFLDPRATDGEGA